ncbi:glycoside hydrolase [Phialemonium atrogriseum]|uniref:mannan endo-1,4-beta-mannosidase n=1 Tax=Phialemonium atrogriseum TaxID=1093897 RepID=A0AAJ0BWI2_9PEZI|nr:glycoside hydrolase [Phialemonium atrogriseum]KAK1764347.1 glycoside hydrolase [Phialemonium atrogriseum]
MKFSLLLFTASALAAPKQQRRDVQADVRDLPVVREGSALLLDGKPWKAVGPNVFWLGLDEDAGYPTKGRITEAMATVKALGGTAIRAHTLGVSVEHPLSVMPSPGQVNEKAFDTIDWAVYQAREYGLRLLVPLTDNWDYYHGGKYTFLRWAGFALTQNRDSKNPQIQQFYTNATIVASFKDYIQKLVTHVNQYTNISYADDPTIFAYETGNELEGPVSRDLDVPVAWVSEIGKLLKSLAPKKLVVDGTYGVSKAHLDVPELDIFSNHGYPVSVSKLQSDLSLVATVNKTFFAGEYTWNSQAGGDSSLASFFQAIEQSPIASGDMFWSLFGHNVPDCKTFVNHNDGLTLQLGNPANSAFTNSRIQLIRQHFVKMSQGLTIAADAALPVVPCPAPEVPADDN